MISRDTIKSLINFIELRPNKIDKLKPKDKLFYRSIKQASLNYGYSFSEKQLKYLESIYRQVYNNI